MALKFLKPTAIKIPKVKTPKLFDFKKFSKLAKLPKSPKIAVLKRTVKKYKA